MKYVELDSTLIADKYGCPYLLNTEAMAYSQLLEQACKSSTRTVNNSCESNC